MNAEVRMAPLVTGRLVIATHNQGKLWEFRELLAPFPVELVSAGELDLAEPEETGTTFAENARLKATLAAEASGLPALADDSGVFIPELWGAPGIFTARWAGPERDFMVAMRRVEEELAARGATAPERRRAAFVASLCLAFPDGRTVEVEGAAWGGLVWPPRGTKGFGYDPMFLPDGEARTFGEMMAAEKHGIDWQAGRVGLSHRAKAVVALVARVFGEVPRR